MRSLDPGVAGVKGRSGKTEDPLRAKSPCPTEFESLASDAFGLFSAVYSSQVDVRLFACRYQQSGALHRGRLSQVYIELHSISIEARSLNRWKAAFWGSPTPRLTRLRHR